MNRLGLACLALTFALPLSACGKKGHGGPILQAGWRNTPEDLPYEGKVPNIKTVTYDLRLTDTVTFARQP